MMPTTAGWLILIILAILLILSAMNNGRSHNRSASGEGRDLSRCIQASNKQVELINYGIKNIEESNYINSAWAVKSVDFENVWIVAAKIYGPGIDNGTGPGIWAISGMPDQPGLTLSIDGFAKEFSYWNEADSTDAKITMENDGAKEAKLCAEIN